MLRTEQDGSFLLEIDDADGGNVHMKRVSDVPFIPQIFSEEPYKYVPDTLREQVLKSHQVYRSRRAGQPTSQDIVCTMFLDADQRFHTQWGGPCPAMLTTDQCTQLKLARSTARMVDIIHQVRVVFFWGERKGIRNQASG